jgi:hypothetical protein
VVWLLAMLCYGIARIVHGPSAVLKVNAPLVTDNHLSSETVVARVLCPNSPTLSQLAAHLDVWSIDRDQQSLLVMLSRDEMENLSAQGFPVQIDVDRTAKLSQLNNPLPAQASGLPGYPCYRTVEETYESMRSLAARAPLLVTWNAYGYSWQWGKSNGAEGYPLMALVITNRASLNGKVPVIIAAEMHAREYPTAELAARFAERLVRDYAVDPDVTWLLDHTEIHILPMVNPDGRKYAELGYTWRKNANSDYGCAFPSFGVDLNRNSSYGWGIASNGPCDETYEGPRAASEPETSALQDYITTVFASHRASESNWSQPNGPKGLFITLHSFGNYILYPWGFTSDPPPFADSFKVLADRFGALASARPMQSYALYPTPGDTEDWVYGTLGVPGFTFEIGNDFFQDCGTFNKQLDARWSDALLFALKAAHQSFQTPVGPDSLQVALSASPVALRSQISLTALAVTTGKNSILLRPRVAGARYSIDVPSWSPAVATHMMRAADGVFDSAAERVTADIDIAGMLFGRHIVFVESQDDNGNWGPPSATFLDVTPLATFDLGWRIAIPVQPSFSRRMDYLSGCE